MAARAAALVAACALAAATSGCVYRMNIMQGNYLEAAAVEQVAVGMTRSQVRFLLGTPMVADSFTPNRWDYVYLFKDGRTRKVDRRHFIVWFEDEKVARIDKPDGEIVDPKMPTSPGA
ncbi:MAG: outer membrane protein assembly factor BamE [Steroidobacteraceae bacterium]|jgi:outer membrane protein assembly factor BamE|nr:outer membrane protein assembly factor BamE [Steroidobacteraceae bacterium]